MIITSYYTNFLVEMRKVILEKTDKKCKKDEDGKSPGYNLYKDCVSKFVRDSSAFSDDGTNVGKLIP